MSDRRHIGSGTEWEARVGYSRAVKVGDRVVVAGTTAVVDGQIEGVDDPYRQTVVILEKIQQALQQAGAALEEVIRTRIYITDIRHWEVVGEAHGEFFGTIKPVTTLVAVKALVDPKMLVEIEAEAVLAGAE